MLAYPQLNPIALSIGPLKIHWYGLMYLLGFLVAWFLAHYRTKRFHLPWTKALISDLIFYTAVGVIVGGRLGYMLFYDTARFISQPWVVFKIWEGGMSFHGGLLGVAVALLWFARSRQKTYLEVCDFFAPLVPFGLAAGRAGNFINGELWGRVTDVPWGMIFPQVDFLPRHPSQLYELGLEGVGLFILVWWYAAKPRPTGCVSAIFLMGYAVARFIAECFRQPDIQMGFIAFDWMTMGQVLSLPMFIVGFWLWWSKRDENLSTAY